MYALKVLKEAQVASQNNFHQLFEEAIILTNEFDPENKTSDYEKEILAKLTRLEPIYKNEYGEDVVWQAVLVVDTSEVEEQLSFVGEFCEVFSRFIEMPPHATKEEVVATFYPDYPGSLLP